MNWKLVLKDKANQPPGKDYTAWKEQIARECYHQCVYCAIHENPWGGIDHYHIDHYRPKSIAKFKVFELDIVNLFYACPICNRFKSNDWPAEPNEVLNICCYPDPSLVDYSTLFQLDTKSFMLSGNNSAARYVIERLYLNRPQLIFERREAYLNEIEVNIRSGMVELLHKVDDKTLTNRFLVAIDNLLNLKDSRKAIRPYQQFEIKRQI